LDPDATDRSGRTATAYIEMRANLPDGFIHAFDRLVEKIKRDNASALESFESDDENDFVDALENL
jgi:hypothetical protein